jgi:hypothetical protein
MDTRLPLMVQSPDFAGSMVNGLTAGDMARSSGQQNALAQLYQAQGPQIMQGDPNALNALARMDPNAAQGIQMNNLGMQQSRLNMQLTQTQMQDVRDRAKAEAAKQAAQVSADELKAAAAQTEQILRGAAPLYMAMQQGIPGAQEKLLGYLQSQGLPATPDTIDTIMYGSQGALEGMKAYADLQPATPSASDRFKVVGNQVVDLMAEGGPKPVMEAPGQTETIYGPDGQPIITRGPAKPFTEAQDKSNIYATRAEGALTALEPVADALTSLKDTTLGGVPVLGRYGQSDQFQMAKQAGDEFLQAILRKDTGAAITPDEQSLYGDTFLPRPGDGAAVLAQKKASRARAIEALRSGMSMDQINATERALVEAAKRTGIAEGSAPPPGGTDQLTPEELQYLGLP